MNEFTRPTKSDIDLAIEGEYDSMPRVRRGGMRYGQGVNKLASPTGYKMVPIEKVEPLKIDVEVYGEYQLFGDIETDDWVARTFQEPKDAGDIIDYKTVYITTGAWGLRFVTFTVHASVPAGTTEHIRQSANDLLFKLVGESDVELRYITML